MSPKTKKNRQIWSHCSYLRRARALWWGGRTGRRSARRAWWWCRCRWAGRRPGRAESLSSPWNAMGLISQCWGQLTASAKIDWDNILHNVIGTLGGKFHWIWMCLVWLDLKISTKYENKHQVITDFKDHNCKYSQPTLLAILQLWCYGNFLLWNICDFYNGWPFWL